MTDAEFEDYLKNRYQDQISWYDRKAIRNKRLYNVFQTCVILFSGLAAILAALNPQWEKPALIILTTLATAFSMIMVAYRYQELWMNYRTVCETLRKEIHYYTARIGEYHTSSSPRQLFVQRVEAFISRENTMMLLPLFQDRINGKSVSTPPKTGV
jgi:hypothetical protein